MKKLIALFLAAIMTVSLTACGGSFQIEIENNNEGTATTETTTIITEAGADDEVSTTTTKKNQQQKTTKKTTKKTTAVTTTKKTTTTTKKTTAPNKQPQGNKLGEIIITAKSELKADASLSGLYALGGYSRSSFGNNISFIATIEGVDKDNEGEVDLSKAGIEHIDTDMLKFLYFDITFDGKTISNWDIVDRISGESVLSLTEDEFNKKYFPETTYETVKAGDLPTTIYLSEYELGKAYEFDIPKNTAIATPVIINDSKYPLIIVSRKDSDGWDRKYKSIHTAPDISIGVMSDDKGKYTLAFIEGDVKTLFASGECFLLEGCKEGEKLNRKFEDYIGNNTNKTITLSVFNNGKEHSFTLKPNEVLEVSWIDRVVLKTIK